MVHELFRIASAMELFNRFQQQPDIMIFYLHQTYAPS